MGKATLGAGGFGVVCAVSRPATVGLPCAVKVVVVSAVVVAFGPANHAGASRLFVVVMVIAVAPVRFIMVELVPVGSSCFLVVAFKVIIIVVTVFVISRAALPFNPASHAGIVGLWLAITFTFTWAIVFIIFASKFPMFMMLVPVVVNVFVFLGNFPSTRATV